MEEKLKAPQLEPKVVPPKNPDAEDAAKQALLMEGFKWNRLIWPILIGLGVLVYAVYQFMQEGVNPITDVKWTGWVFGMIGLGFACMLMRDFGYIWRMRILTDEKLSWKSAFQVTLLWEFASAASPSIVGGSALAIYMLIKEKISAGRTTAIVFVTIFFDELFYLFIVPFALILIDWDNIAAPLSQTETFLGTGLAVGFWIAYGIIVAYVLFLAFALFIRPEGTSKVLRKLFHTRLLRKWRDSGDKTAEDLLIAAKEFRQKKLSYWLQAWLATCLAWFGRYLVVNCILAAFTILTFGEHLIAFARQAVMFVVMLLSLTPGSSGVAEGMFDVMLAEFSPEGFGLLLATLWRLITYYPYLFLGVFLLPVWMRKVNSRKLEKPANDTSLG